MQNNYQYTNQGGSALTTAIPNYYQSLLPDQIVNLGQSEPTISLKDHTNQIRFINQRYEQGGQTNEIPNVFTSVEYSPIQTTRHSINGSNDIYSSSNIYPMLHLPVILHEQDDKLINFPIHRLPNNVMLSLPIYHLLANLYTSIQTKRYATSAIIPLRNFLTVYEYTVNNHSVIWDYETGFVHLTGIWKAAESKYTPQSHEVKVNVKAKADIVKLLDSTPKQYQNYIKRIRGGFLKIQGTWLPYNLCKILAKRFCFNIRFELIPLFGHDFPDSCLKPTDKKFGELKFDDVNIELDNFDVFEASKCLESLSHNYVKPVNSTDGGIMAIDVMDRPIESSYTTNTNTNAGIGVLEPPFQYMPNNQDHKRSRSQHQFDNFTSPTPLMYHSTFSNYTMSPVTPETKNDDGISSILLAADLTSDTKCPSSKSRRLTIKINDLIS